jgi:hypothetical protein
MALQPLTLVPNRLIPDSWIRDRRNLRIKEWERRHYSGNHRVGIPAVFSDSGNEIPA